MLKLALITWIWMFEHIIMHMNVTHLIFQGIFGRCAENSKHRTVTQLQCESWVWPSIPRPRTSAQLMSERMPLNQFSHHFRFGLCPSHRRKADHTHCTGESDSQLTTRYDRVQQLGVIRIDDSSNSICRRRTVTCIMLCNLQLQLLLQFKYREIDNCFPHNNVDNRNNWLPNHFPLSKCVWVCALLLKWLPLILVVCA